MVLNAIGYPKPLSVTGYKSDFFGKDPTTYPDHPEYAQKFGVDDFAAAFIRLEGGIILDFRIAWAMNVDTPGDTIILGTKGGLRIPSTDCWNGSVGGPMTIYKTIGGINYETQVPIINDGGRPCSTARSAPSWMPARPAARRPSPPRRSSTTRRSWTALPVPRSWVTRSSWRSRKSDADCIKNHRQAPGAAAPGACLWFGVGGRKRGTDAARSPAKRVALFRDCL